MIGTQLESGFGTEKWIYSSGYYPRLKWLRDDPVAALFAATRGAFTSVVVGETSSDDMFAGNISGPIEVPAEMQTENHTYEATGDLSVDDSGLITPTGTGGGTITIKYDDGLYSAQNSYTFNTSGVPSIKKNFQSVTLSPVKDVKIGTVLTASAKLDSKDTTTNPGSITYQWYKRAGESAGKELMAGETGSTYTVKPTDAGYSFMVMVSANGYWDSGTAFTNSIAMTAPSSPPDVTSDDYQTVTVTGKGGAISRYDFAYSRTENGEKTIVKCDELHPVTQTITGLDADTDYWFFARVAGDTGYSAGPWSAGRKITTKQIPLDGGITLNDSINVDTTLTAVMDDKNLQTGSWKVERVNGSTNTDITNSGYVTINGTYEASYRLQAADVGSKIRFTFTANGKFTGSKSADSQKIEQAVYPAPGTAPMVRTKTDTTVTLAPYSGNISTDLSVYEYGCQLGGGAVTVLSSTVEAVTSPAEEAGIRIRGLSRNTAYAFYVRRKAATGYIASNWSPAVTVTTEKTDISGMGPLIFTIGAGGEALATPTVEDTITATAPAGLTGSWSMEKTLLSQSATLFGYTVADGGLAASYTLQAQDAGYTVRAVFRGTGDFTGEIATSMASMVAARKYAAPGTGSFVVSGRTDATLIVKLAEGLSGSYQVGKRLAGTGGTKEVCVGSVQQGNSYTVTGLERNKTYELFIRRLEETGYQTSDWSAAVSETTAKTDVNGDIQITGILEVNKTLTAEYQGGYYAQNGLEDDKGGTYTWKAGEEVRRTESGARSTYDIQSGDRGKRISVEYTPPGSSDFQGNRSKLVGVVEKTTTVPPQVPVLSPQTNAEAGSVLRITNAVSGAWYLPVQSNGTTDSLPDFVPESEAVAAGWIQASGSALDFTGLSVNTDYLVYGAHLETETDAASRMVVSAKTRTWKEEIAKGAAGSGSTGITGPGILKPMDGDGTKVSIAVYRKAPTGTWNWYAAKQKGGSDGWKIIRSEKHEEAAGAAEASDTYKIPYEYSGYYLKVEFLADGDYTGQEIWEPEAPLADREITGAVTITPEGGNGNQRLFEKLTAAYEGTDDRSGTWRWYREDSSGSGGWTAISAERYTAAGPESVYTPAGEDVGKKLKAVYTAAGFGCTGSSETETGAIAAAVQTRPAAPKLVLISGTNITLADSEPGLAGPYGSRPEAVFGYRKASEPDTAIVWLDSGNLVSRLDPLTGYVFYTKYKSTEVYAESRESPATAEISTGAGVLYPSGLSLVYDESEGEAKKLDVGRTVTAVYQGEGWDKGSFTVKRSNGQELPEKGEGVPDGYTIQTDEAGERISCSYKLPAGMAGFSLTFVYTARADSGYSGSVEILTGAVKKPVGASPVKAELRKNLDTDFYLTNVTDGQEYALVKAVSEGVVPEEPGRNSSLWQSLAGDSTGAWHYTGLERGTTYYVYTRRAETTEHEVSESVVSEPVTTESFLYMGEIRLINEQDVTAQPVGIGISQEIPSTLNGDVTVDSVRVLEKSGSNSEVSLNATERLSEFVNDSGGVRYLNPNVYEKGSTWANGRFATTLRLSDSSGQYAELEAGERSSFSAGDTMTLSIYRANAVTEGGSYWWEITLKDDEGTEALLKADVTIITQMKATVPLRIALQIKDQEIHQTTNGAGLKNSNGMPVEVSVNEKPGAGDGMPDLLGEPVESDPQRMDPGAVYLKLSVDGSIETGQVTDLWLNTTLPSASVRPLIKLGASSQADYYISGIISENGTVNWPWPDDGSQTIQEAYQLKFIYEISADGYPVYTPKISSPDSNTTSQEGGES